MNEVGFKSERRMSYLYEQWKFLDSEQFVFLGRLLETQFGFMEKKKGNFWQGGRKKFSVPPSCFSTTWNSPFLLRQTTITFKRSASLGPHAFKYIYIFYITFFSGKGNVADASHPSLHPPTQPPTLVDSVSVPRVALTEVVNYCESRRPFYCFFFQYVDVYLAHVFFFIKYKIIAILLSSR